MTTATFKSKRLNKTMLATNCNTVFRCLIRPIYMERKQWSVLSLIHALSTVHRLGEAPRQVLGASKRRQLQLVGARVSAGQAALRLGRHDDDLRGSQAAGWKARCSRHELQEEPTARGRQLNQLLDEHPDLAAVGSVAAAGPQGFGELHLRPIRARVAAEEGPQLLGLERPHCAVRVANVLDAVTERLHLCRDAILQPPVCSTLDELLQVVDGELALCATLAKLGAAQAGLLEGTELRVLGERLLTSFALPPQVAARPARRGGLLGTRPPGLVLGGAVGTSLAEVERKLRSRAHKLTSPAVARPRQGGEG
mmetsp:Transcript_68967/g.184674  ORF Transcript_68967/g.184674 Transcript_68967/m.184674 type:complete len:310 (+) Transcript_68967:38-967(+)